MKRIKTLRIALVAFVVLVMMLSGFFAGALMMASRFLPFFMPGASLMMSFLPTVLLMIVGGLVISTVFSERLLAPIRELAHAHRKVAEGDFSVRVEESGNLDEMGELQRSFNHMAEDLGSIEMFRTDFINSFSHEFKTPIVSIRGFARQLQRGGLTQEQQKEYLDIIVRESDRLANLSVNVLMLTRLENQQIVTDKVSFQLDEQLRSCILLLEKRWTEKKLELDIELEPINYYNNTELMSHMWVNLLENAIKFSPPGGTLGVRCRRNGSDIEVSISDTGIGMDEETQKYIFNKFYQGDNSHTSPGNGVGLAVVRRVAELAGGKVSVKSAPGEGSVFTVTLPAEQKKA